MKRKMVEEQPKEQEEQDRPEQKPELKVKEFFIKIGDIQFSNFETFEKNIGLLDYIFKNKNIQRYLNILKIKNKQPDYID